MKNPLPYFAAFLTQHDRQIVEVGVDFEWSPRSWTHNVFRVFELLFGRKAGGRCESAVDLNSGKVYTYTIEAAIAQVEGKVREFLFPEVAPFRIVFPAIQTPVGQIRMFPVLLAAYDSSGSTLYGASPRTFSLTCTGSNRLMVFNPSSLTDSAGTQSYNSVSGTSINKTTFPGVGRTGTTLFYLNAPATGSNTVSCAAGSSLMGMAASYTGFNQTSAVVDSSGVTTATDTTPTGTTTVVAANCWLITGMSDSAGSGQPYTSGTGTVRVSSNDGACIFDSNNTVSTGSQSINITHNSGWACVTASFLTAAAAVTVTPDLRTYFYA